MNRVALLSAIFVVCSVSTHAQECPRLHFFEVDSDKVYRAGQKVQSEEPHGVDSGWMSVDTMSFVCPLRNSIKKSGSLAPGETYEEGSLVVSMRRATDGRWSKKIFFYRCEDRSLKPGKMELAVFNGKQTQVGSLNAICNLSIVSG
jgi:hypothetical protein